MVESFPSMHKAPGLILAVKKRKRKSRRRLSWGRRRKEIPQKTPYGLRAAL